MAVLAAGVFIIKQVLLFILEMDLNHMSSLPGGSDTLITDNLKWSTHTDSVVKAAQQGLFNLRRLKKFGLAPKTLTIESNYSTIESILSGWFTAWYGVSTILCNSGRATSEK